MFLSWSCFLWRCTTDDIMASRFSTAFTSLHTRKSSSAHVVNVIQHVSKDKHTQTHSVPLSFHSLKHAVWHFLFWFLSCVIVRRFVLVLPQKIQIKYLYYMLRHSNKCEYAEFLLNIALYFSCIVVFLPEVAQFLFESEHYIFFYSDCFLPNIWWTVVFPRHAWQRQNHSYTVKPFSA